MVSRRWHGNCLCRFASEISPFVFSEALQPRQTANSAFWQRCSRTACTQCPYRSETVQLSGFSPIWLSNLCVAVRQAQCATKEQQQEEEVDVVRSRSNRSSRRRPRRRRRGSGGRSGGTSSSIVVAVAVLVVVVVVVVLCRHHGGSRAGNCDSMFDWIGNGNVLASGPDIQSGRSSFKISS